MKKSNFGTSPCFILLMVFVVLKLCGVIEWSWWWVISPLWIPTPLLVLAVILKSAWRK